MVGKTIAHYEVFDEIGAGGMGVVYRARDTRLDRPAAIKALPEELAEDSERLARFEREAKLLASLKNPHIATVYGLEEVEDRRFLAMELVEGTTLAEKLSKGPIPVEEALELARQIAEALVAAHEADVIHRDLKPGNIMIGPNGEAKVLDFGLAKAVRKNVPAGDMETSPTLTQPMTRAGLILGTPVYMSPEQAEGQEAGKQSDIWAFGCVLYEMLAGKRAFQGPTREAGSTPEWDALPKSTPLLARSVLRRCLEKELRRRLHDIADVRIELEEALWELSAAKANGAPVGTKRSAFLRGTAWALGGVAVAALLGLAGWLWTRPEERGSEIAHFDLRPPSGVRVSQGDARPTLALSPDGKWIAFVGHLVESPARRQLYLRSLEELEAQPLPGTAGAYNPFFSPDSQWLGFVASGLMQKVPVAGGEPLRICKTTALRGASWGEDGSILFAPGLQGLLRVSASGGDPETVTVPAEGERHHRWPQLLPGARMAVFSIYTDRRESHREIGLLSLETGKYRTLVTGGTYPRYLHTGHLLFSRLGTLYSALLDLERGELTSQPRPVLEEVWAHYGSGRVSFEVAETGSLLYVPGSYRVTDRELVWVDRRGNVEPAVREHRAFQSPPALSPDGSRLAITIQSGADRSEIHIYEFERGLWTRLTSEGEANVDSYQWSPDGAQIIYSSSREGSYSIYSIATDGSGTRERLTTAPTHWDHPQAISPDGVVAFLRASDSPPPGFDLLTLTLGGDEPPKPFLATAASEGGPVFSPDGRWIAYVSDESGQHEVYVRAFPGPGVKVKISANGGGSPRWPNSREVIYVLGRKLFSVPIRTQPEFAAGRPKLLIETDFDFYLAWQQVLSSDDQPFLMLRFPEEAPGGGRVTTQGQRLVYVPNWTETLTRMAAGGTD